MDLCFSIMPFHKSFDDVNETIEAAVREVGGLEYLRADYRRRPGVILGQINEDIDRATVIVVDVTGREFTNQETPHGHNPNVFYELGIAHRAKGPSRVILIRDEAWKARIPFDIQAFRQIGYSSLAQLRADLVQAISEVLESNEDQEIWNVLRGSLERTQLIARDLAGLATDGLATRVRMIAGLGSLSIDDAEFGHTGDDEPYAAALRAERDNLIAVLRRGGTLHASLSPPLVFTREAAQSRRLILRYERLIRLLRREEPHSDFMSRCTFVWRRIPMPHLLILGEAVAYQGLKQRPVRGFHLTHVETNRARLREMINEFDRSMNHARVYRTEAEHQAFARLLRTLLDKAIELANVTDD